MKKWVSKLFRWNPSRDALIAFASGGVVIGLSAAMLLFKNHPWASIAIRDVGQILLAGILFPVWWIHRSGDAWEEFGFSFRKWPLFLTINIVLGALLLFMFLSESPPPENFHLDASKVWSAAYVMAALCFELVFFYAFLRALFERAFGVIPALVLTALFYAFHHIGFQPEYGKLIFVGMMYGFVYRCGNSALLIFPFFLGIGGTYDVLIQSKVISPIQHPEIRTLYLAAALFIMAGWAWKKARP